MFANNTNINGGLPDKAVAILLASPNLVDVDRDMVNGFSDVS